MVKIKYPSIPEEAIVTIKISGTFYRSLAQLLLGLAEELTQEEYKKIVKKLTDKEGASNVKELSAMLVTALVFSIEAAAEEQKLTTEVEVDVPDEPAKG